MHQTFQIVYQQGTIHLPFFHPLKVGRNILLTHFPFKHLPFLDSHFHERETKKDSNFLFVLLEAQNMRDIHRHIYLFVSMA
jgi:hypothetical protein